jgi:hypothetical protein
LAPSWPVIYESDAAHFNINPNSHTLCDNTRYLICGLLLGTGVDHGESNRDGDRRNNHRCIVVGDHALTQQVDCEVGLSLQNHVVGHHSLGVASLRLSLKSLE